MPLLSSGFSACLLQIGVQRIFLDAATDHAKDVWTSNSLGFSVINESAYRVLVKQYTLVENDPVAARCLRVIPDRSAMLTQVRPSTTAEAGTIFGLPRPPLCCSEL